MSVESAMACYFAGGLSLMTLFDTTSRVRFDGLLVDANRHIAHRHHLTASYNTTDHRHIRIEFLLIWRRGCRTPKYSYSQNFGQ